MSWFTTEGGGLLALGAAIIGSIVGTPRALRIALLVAGVLVAATGAWPTLRAGPLALGGLLALINGLALLRISGGGRALTSDESLFHQRHLARLSPGDARLLIDQGNYVAARAGEQLTHAGQRAETLYFLAAGTAAVIVDGTVVGRLDPGDLIGEAALLPDGVASASVEVVEDGARLWFIPRDRLDQFLAAQPVIAAELRAATLAALQAKLQAANRR